MPGPEQRWGLTLPLPEYVAGGITLPILTPITEPEKMVALIEELAPR